jgi:DnaJ family protein B protein 13
LTAGYRFSGNSYEIFEKFFGVSNPYAENLNSETSLVDKYLNGQPYIQAPNDITVHLECTLYEFYNGCFKTIDYDREVLQFDGRITRTVREEL